MAHIILLIYFGSSLLVYGNLPPCRPPNQLGEFCFLFIIPLIQSNPAGFISAYPTIVPPTYCLTQNMISAGTPVWQTVNLWLIVAEANAGHRCCNITDRGPQKRLNYNDKGLKLRDARLTKQYLLLFVSYCHSNDIQQLSPSVTPTPFPSTRASQNGPSGVT
jgi:hypothetical protein